MVNEEKDQYLTEQITKFTKELREAYYQTVDHNHEYPEVPNGGDIKDSTTNSPAIYLEGPHCCKSSVGCCVNCFYSMYAQHDTKQAMQKMKEQVDWILDHFDEEVVMKQAGSGRIDFKDFRFSEKEPIVVTISPTGSYFSEYEFPQEVRMYMLQKLLEKSEEYEREVILFVEAHATDIYAHGINEEEAILLRKLHTKCILGFESANEYSRNVLYNKKLPQNVYENAVNTLQENGIDVGSFVMGGLITYTDLETKQDMLDTVRYLKSKEVYPVMMFSNVQQYTIPDILQRGEKYRLLQPFTTTDTIQEMFEIIGEDSYWMIPEPVSGPPVPKDNIFYNRIDTTTSDQVNRELHRMLFMLRMTRDSDTFMKNYEEFKGTHQSEYQEYQKMIEEQQAKAASLEDRADNMICYVRENIVNYIQEMKTVSDDVERQEESEDITIKSEAMQSLNLGEDR